MKFGKLIRAEAINNRQLKFVNYKVLKYHLKCWANYLAQDEDDKAYETDKVFRETVHSEMQTVGASFWAQSNLLEEAFSAFQANFLERFGISETNFQPAKIFLDDASSRPQLDSRDLYDACVDLKDLSTQCKVLQRAVLWNSMAIVKSLKKRNKYAQQFPQKSVDDFSAAAVLASQDWYQSRKLPRINSQVETVMQSVMHRITRKPLNLETYRCPICLDIIVDPVTLRACGHRFCWTCLCMLYYETSVGSLVKCPYCRTSFRADPEAFRIDSILSELLQVMFPEIQKQRLREKHVEVKQRLENVLRPKEPFLFCFPPENASQRPFAGSPTQHYNPFNLCLTSSKSPCFSSSPMTELAARTSPDALPFRSMPGSDKTAHFSASQPLLEIESVLFSLGEPDVSEPPCASSIDLIFDPEPTPDFPLSMPSCAPFKRTTPPTSPPHVPRDSFIMEQLVEWLARETYDSSD